MKNRNNYVPVCGQNNEDVGRPIAPWNFIPANSDPSEFYDVPKETIYVKSGDNPFDLIEVMVSKKEMKTTWVIIEKSVLEQAKKIPAVYHFDSTVSNPEVFNFGTVNFSKPKIIHLNTIAGFDNWKIICAWMGRKEKEFTVPVGDNPDKIVRVVMD